MTLSTRRSSYTGFAIGNVFVWMLPVLCFIRILTCEKLKVESVVLTSCLSAGDYPSHLPAYDKAAGTLRSNQKTIEKIATTPNMTREMKEAAAE